ncbi:MAG: hypothetical protein U5K28_05010 [Halobacteriales archaeon]|nr:hypothetical protein [Halobacteriales archaeon]
MRKTPRSQRAQLWAWLYVQLFGTPDDTEDDDSETSPAVTDSTDPRAAGG